MKADWLLIATAPVEMNIEVAIIDGDGLFALRGPVRRTELGWVDADTNLLLDLRPTHWRVAAHRDQAS
jgi:hypothetical protein